MKPTTIEAAIALSEDLGLALMGEGVTGPCRHQGKRWPTGQGGCLRRARREDGLLTPDPPLCVACRAYWNAIQLTESLRAVQKDIGWAKLEAAVEAETKTKQPKQSKRRG